MKESNEFYIPGGVGVGNDAGEALCDILGLVLRPGNPRFVSSNQPRVLPDLSDDTEEFCTDMMRDPEEQFIDGGVRWDIMPPVDTKS
jgi:hypothetical protein